MLLTRKTETEHFLIWIDSILYRIWYDGRSIRYEGFGGYTIT
jgi:hypothetical protein